eukprot:1139044-Pelagomonas_calceolata.AAC.8
MGDVQPETFKPVSKYRVLFGSKDLVWHAGDTGVWRLTDSFSCNKHFKKVKSTSNGIPETDSRQSIRQVSLNYLCNTPWVSRNAARTPRFSHTSQTCRKYSRMLVEEHRV